MNLFIKDNNQYKIHESPYTSGAVEENPTNQIKFLKFGLVDWLAVQKVVQILVKKLTVI